MSFNLGNYFKPQEGLYSDVQEGKLVAVQSWSQEASIRTINYLAQHIKEHAIPENRRIAQQMLETLKQFPENSKATTVLTLLIEQNSRVIERFTQLSPESQEIAYTSNDADKLLLMHDLSHEEQRKLAECIPYYALLEKICQTFQGALPSLVYEIQPFVQDNHIVDLFEYLLVPRNQKRFLQVQSYLNEQNPAIIKILLLRRFRAHFHFEKDLLAWSNDPTTMKRLHGNLNAFLNTIRTQEALDEIKDAFTTYGYLFGIEEGHPLYQKMLFVASLVSPESRHLYNNPFEIEDSILNHQRYNQEQLLESTKRIPSTLKNRPILISLENIRKCKSDPLRLGLNYFLLKVFENPQFLQRVMGNEPVRFTESLTTYLTNRLYIVVGLEHTPDLQLDSYNLPESVVRQTTEDLLKHFCHSCLGDDLAGAVREALKLASIEEADQLLFRENIFLRA